MTTHIETCYMENVPSLFNNAKSPGPDIYYRADFRDVVETHIPILLTNAKTTEQLVEPQMAYKNDGNFVGLLNDLGIKNELHWIVMRLNGMYSPTEYTSDRISILLPPDSYISQLVRMHTTIHVIR